MRKPTSAAEATTPAAGRHRDAGQPSGLRHRARPSATSLRPSRPQPNLHAAAEWGDDPDVARTLPRRYRTADIVFANMLFMEDHIKPVLDVA